jgi:hypothetical protein
MASAGQARRIAMEHASLLAGGEGVLLTTDALAPNLHTESEPRFRESRAAIVEVKPPLSRVADPSFPLGMVLEACPEILDYAKGEISNWRDFVAAAAVIRSMLGISPSAWDEAQSVMGERQAAPAVAAILPRGAAIASARGYLRDLPRKPEAGEFSTGPTLMALIRGWSARREERDYCRRFPRGNPLNSRGWEPKRVTKSAATLGIIP